MALYPRIPLATLLTLHPEILDSFYYPEADLENFISYFQLEYGEFTPIYQEPSLLAAHVKATAAHAKPIIDKWYAVLTEEYDPLETYLRVTDRTDVRTPDLTAEDSESSSKTENSSGSSVISGGHTKADAPKTTEHKVSADNTNNYYESDLTTEVETSTTTTFNNETTAQSGNKQGSASMSGSEKLTGTDKNKRDETVHGKPGWFSNQDLLKQELEVRKFDLMVEAGRLYAEELLILIY